MTQACSATRTPSATRPYGTLSGCASRGTGRNRGRSWLGVALGQGLQQISYGKQRQTQNRTPEIEVMANALLTPPLHPRKQVQCFTGRSENDPHQTPCPE